MSNMKKILITLSLLFIAFTSASAQKWSVGTNILDWMYLGTMNAEASVAVQRHLTVNAEVLYNPWTFNKADPSVMLSQKQATAQLGLRYWPWSVYSGWWIGGGIQYEAYNMSSIFTRKKNGNRTEEGDAFGAGLKAGYTLMLHKHLNVEFSAGLWGGVSLYTTYSCPKCGRIVDSGTKGFVMPNDLAVSLVWIF